VVGDPVVLEDVAEVPELGDEISIASPAALSG
jgi:hypothetical protein